jgi:hypothetical protein
MIGKVKKVHFCQETDNSQKNKPPIINPIARNKTSQRFKYLKSTS